MEFKMEDLDSLVIDEENIVYRVTAIIDEPTVLLKRIANEEKVALGTKSERAKEFKRLVVEVEE